VRGGGALLCVIIIDDQAGVNNARNPTQQSQNEAEKKTGYATCQQDGQGWQHNAEKISQRFHFFFFLFVLLF
jgi:hypothetical protein